MGLPPLGRLKKLESLDLFDTYVTDEGLPSLRGLTRLRLLNLQETPLRRLECPALKTALPNTDIRFHTLIKPRVWPVQRRGRNGIDSILKQ